MLVDMLASLQGAQTASTLEKRGRKDEKEMRSREEEERAEGLVCSDLRAESLKTLSRHSAVRPDVNTCKQRCLQISPTVSQ